RLDVEGVRRGVEVARAGLQSVAAARLVQGEVRERGHAAAGRRGQRAAEGAAAGVAGQEHADAAGEVRIDVAEGVLAGDDQAEAAARGDAGGRRSGDHQLRGRAGLDRDGAGHSGAEAGAARLEGVAAARLVEGEVGEGGQAAGGVQG